jgi:3-hydroxyacyl-[acyl-carrier-protein] dehydratase
MSTLDVDAIQELIPHRYPFLFVDRVEDLEPGVSAKGLKLVTSTESWCAGHFPGQPILPGVLITEAMAQTAAVIYMSAFPANAGKKVYLVGTDRMRFRQPVRPGDVLELHVEAVDKHRNLWTFKAEARVGDKKVADGKILATTGG